MRFISMAAQIELFIKVNIAFKQQKFKRNLTKSEGSKYLLRDAFYQGNPTYQIKNK